MLVVTRTALGALVAATLGVRVVLDGVVGDDDAAAAAALALGGKRLQQAVAQALAGHLHQAQGGDLGDLVAGAVAAECLVEAAQYEILVFGEDHVDEVDDDHAADVAQADLAHDLLGGLQVVGGDRLFQRAAGAGELAGVDVDDGHGLGAVDDQGATRRQPHSARQRLLQLLVDAVDLEGVLAVVAGAVKLLQAIQKVRGDGLHVGVDGVPRLAAVHDERGEVLVEQVAHNLDQDVRLLIQGHRFRALGVFLLFRLLLDRGPLVVQPVHVGRDGFFRHVFGGGADDRPALAGHDVVQDFLQALALRRRQLAGNARAAAARHIHQVAPGQRDLGGQARTFVADGVLSHLHQHLVAGFEGLFNAARAPAQTGGLPVHLGGVEHAVAALPDVDERGFHAGQHVLHAPQVDVADHGGLAFGGDEVLHQKPVLEHADLGDLAVAVAAVALAHHHVALDGLAARQKLGLADNAGALALLFALLCAAAALRFQTG